LLLLIDTGTAAGAEGVWWYQVALVLAQLDGIFAGYLHNCDPDKV